MSGRKNDGVELAKALAACRLFGTVLVIANLDRLARDAAFLLTNRLWIGLTWLWPIPLNPHGTTKCASGISLGK